MGMICNPPLVSGKSYRYLTIPDKVRIAEIKVCKKSRSSSEIKTSMFYVEEKNVKILECIASHLRRHIKMMYPHIEHNPPAQNCVDVENSHVYVSPCNLVMDLKVKSDIAKDYHDYRQCNCFVGPGADAKAEQMAYIIWRFLEYCNITF